MAGIRDALDDMAAVGALTIDRQRIIRGAGLALDNVAHGKGYHVVQLVLTARAILGALAHDADAAARIWDRMHAEDLREHQAAMWMLAASESPDQEDAAVGAPRASQEGIHD